MVSIVTTRETKKFVSLILALTALAMLAVFTTGIGEPTGPDSITNVSISRFATLSPLLQYAQAGNLSEITIVAQSATKAWQGYFGNVSGTITLENAGGDVFYQWIANEPKGEVYASTNSSITWSTIECFNFTETSTINLSTEEARYDIDSSDVDGINETFNLTSHDEFFVGTVQIATNTCPSAYVFTGSSAQVVDWQNVLLADPSTNSLVFTTIIENRAVGNDTDKVGFDSQPHDFQLLVAEDGHTAAAAGHTVYYFFVEIE